MAWFQLNAGGNPTNPSHYNSVATPSCSGSTKICAVNATDNGSGQPDLTDSLKNEMIVALQNNSTSSNVRLRSTP
ncbi:hypothetical protein [Sphingobacterium sp.]|uniref:hypothetical protein n=1 Tax=Sphingobacterium sp. TaxID=341027 RepID=UPI0031D02B12